MLFPLKDPDPQSLKIPIEDPEASSQPRTPNYPNQTQNTPEPKHVNEGFKIL